MTIQPTEIELGTAINHICLVFGISKEEFMSICYIEKRESLNNWIIGKVKPRKNSLKRIFDLHSIANAWKNHGFEPVKENLHIPQVDRKSLFDILHESELDLEKILFFGSRLNIFK